MYPSALINPVKISNILAEIKDKEQKRCFLKSLACCDNCTCGCDLEEWTGVCLLRRKAEAQNFAYEYIRPKPLSKLP